MKTSLPLLIAAALLSACASKPTLAKFNAAAGPRASQDVQTAIAGATNAVAAQLAASLQANGKIDPAVLGSAAGVGALNALIGLDIKRAQQTNP